MIYEKLLSLKTLGRLVHTFPLLRCERLDRCLCLGAYFATIFLSSGGCFLYLWSILFLVFLCLFAFNPSCVFWDSAGLSESELFRDTEVVVTTVTRSVFWAWRLRSEPRCCFKNRTFSGFNFPLCHVCMWKRDNRNVNVDAQAKSIQRRHGC